MAMKTVELSMSTSYVQDWTAAQGIREIGQNALDAERVSGKKMTIRHDGALNVLTFTTHDARLETKTLLLGMSEKGEGGENAVGRHGEGYKCGILALLREGKSVEIRTGNQMWRPRFVRSATFNAPVLAFDISTYKKESRDIVIEIGGITGKEWEEHSRMFRFTQAVGQVRTAKLLERYHEPRHEGTVLMDGSQRGRIYVGGIFVMETREDDDGAKYKFGYDLPPSKFQLDRDRRVVDSYELASVLSSLWQAIFVDAEKSGDTRTVDLIWEMFADKCPDVAKIESGYNSHDKFTEALLRVFKSRHGDDAHPVGSMAEAHKARDLGLRGGMVPQQVANLLGVCFPSLEVVEKKKKETVVESWSVEGLVPSEAAAMRWAWNLVLKAGAEVTKTFAIESKIPMPQVARFESDSILGVHSDGIIVVSQRLLAPWKKGELICTLMHEWAHSHTSGHGVRMIDIMEKMMESILNQLVGDDETAKAPIHDQDAYLGKSWVEAGRPSSKE